MKIRYVKYILFLFVIISIGCERNISVNLDQTDPKLVVDASIENNGLPLLVLSRSLNYFNSFSTELISNSFEHDAIVSITDGSDTAALIEFSYTNDSGYTFYYYTCDITNPRNVIYGKFGKSYSIFITTVAGANYMASTTIPELTKTCDSLWWKESPDTNDTGKVVLYGLFNDPPGLRNYVRYFTGTNGEPFFPGYTSAFDDLVVDGTTYTFQIPKGYNRNDSLDLNNDDFGFFDHGDTVIFKFCNIDLAAYDFWRTWEYAYQSNGNPFSSPIKVLGNISNGALGAFTGYAAQYRRIIIPE